MEDWAGQLDMTVDEILDYVRERSERDYTFEIGLDIDSLASVVGLTSEEFINVVLTVYIEQRSVGVAEGWASELGMTLDELFEYMMDGSGNCLKGKANIVGVEVDQFIHVLGSVWNVTRTTWEAVEQPSMWHGVILPYNSYWSLLHFTINAETGELTNARYTPWAIDTAGMSLEASFRIITPDEVDNLVPTTQQNYEISKLAMDMAQELNLLNGSAARARIISGLSGFNMATNQPTNEMVVEVQCENGETVMLGFYGIFDNEPMLTFVNTYRLPWFDYSQLELEWVNR